MGDLRVKHLVLRLCDTCISPPRPENLALLRVCGLLQSQLPPTITGPDSDAGIARRACHALVLTPFPIRQQQCYRRMRQRAHLQPSSAGWAPSKLWCKTVNPLDQTLLVSKATDVRSSDSAVGMSRRLANSMRLRSRPRLRLGYLLVSVALSAALVTRSRSSHVTFCKEIMSKLGLPPAFEGVSNHPSASSYRQLSEAPSLAFLLQLQGFY